MECLVGLSRDLLLRCTSGKLEVCGRGLKSVHFKTDRSNMSAGVRAT